MQRGALQVLVYLLEVIGRSIALRRVSRLDSLDRLFLREMRSESRRGRSLPPIREIASTVSLPSAETSAKPRHDIRLRPADEHRHYPGPQRRDDVRLAGGTPNTLGPALDLRLRRKQELSERRDRSGRSWVERISDSE